MRKIIHIDMDCFYAAIEMRDQPRFANVPLAVGGRASGRGVLSTCNYLARQYGLHSAMPTKRALQLCPHVVLVPSRMEVYKQVSQQIQQIFYRYTDLVEPLSLDEAYLEVTGSAHCQGSATRIAEAIRADILKTTRLTASAGVAPLKFLAKIASDLNKPNGLSVIRPDEVNDFIAQLPLEKISGVGKVSIERLHQVGLYTGADVLKASPGLLANFGKMGEMLLERCQGIDPRLVSNARERKSVGVEHTFSHDIANIEELSARLLGLKDELQRRAARHLEQSKVVKLGVKVKFGDFQQTTKEQQAQVWNDDMALALLHEALSRGHGKAVRLLGVHFGLAPRHGDKSEQLNLPW